MPVPFLVPILGAMAGTIAGPALGIGAAAAAGGAAATGIGSLLAAAAPAALGSGIATLAAGGDPREALMNAALAGFGSAAMPGVTSALQGVGGAAAPQAATSAAPAASLRPMMRPTNLTAAAQPAAPAAAGGSSFMDDLGKVKDVLNMLGSDEQQTPKPMPAPQIAGGQPTAVAGGSPFGNILGVQPQRTPTAEDYTGNLSFAPPPETDMSMMPESLNTGIGLLRPRLQDTEQDFSMTRGGIR
jgi:type IV secretion system protein TrbL